MPSVPCFASGRSDAGHQQRLVHLIDAQERNFQLFADFADSEAIAQWQALEASRCIARSSAFGGSFAAPGPARR